MKRILFYIALLILSSQTSFTMQTKEELLEPSPWTRAQVERALKAFEIPLETIKIYGYKEENTRTGFCSSIEKFIAINETGNINQIIHTSFHEAAHIKDDASTKIPRYAKYLTAGFLGVYLSMFPKITAFTENRVTPKFANRVLTLVSSGYGALGTFFGILFYHNAAMHWATEQAEYRADKMAIEKFIELNELDPIAYKLIWEKCLERDNGNQRLGGHPPARAEYKAIKRTLEKNGYEVTKYRPEDAPNDLAIEVTKNGKGRFMQNHNFYTKV